MSIHTLGAGTMSSVVKVMIKRMIRRFFVSLALISTLISCSGDNASTNIELFNPDSLRFILSIDDSDLEVEIEINDSPAQRFRVNPNQPQVQLAITGVIRDQENRITITWSEVIDGTLLNLSEQQDAFVADGNTVIDAAHNFERFDYDNDGVSNYDERLAGTCVWVPVGTCINPGSNRAPNETFDGDNTLWWTTRVESQAANPGEYCVSTPASDDVILTSTGTHTTQLGYIPKFEVDANDSYLISFDARAQRAGGVRVEMNIFDNGVFTIVYEARVELSLDYQRFSLRHDNGSRDWENVNFFLSFGENVDNQYCFDNISVVKIPNS